MIYSAIFLYILILVYKYEIFNAACTHKNKHLMMLFTFFLLVASFRYRLAPDTVWYMTYFENEAIPMSELTLDKIQNAKYQPLWTVINSLGKSLGGYYYFQTIVAFLLNYSIFKFIIRTTSNVFTALLIYYISCYFYFSMEILRESLALSVFILSIIDYDNKNYYRSSVKFLIAVLLHQFAAVLLFTFFLINKNIVFKLKVAVVLVLILFCFVLEDPLVYLFNITGPLGEYDFTIYQLTPDLTFSGFVYNLLRIAPCIYFMYMYRKIPITGLYMSKNIIFSCCLIYVSIVIIRITSIPYVDRFANYFVLFPIVLTASLLVFEIKRLVGYMLTPIVLLIIVSCLMIYTILPMTFLHSENEIPIYKRYYPYSSFFTKSVDLDREYIIKYESKE